MVKGRQELKLKVSDVLGKKTLILGEAGSGKTRLAAELVEKLMALVNRDRITVIDFAPRRISQLGGKLSDYVTVTGGVRYLTPNEVHTPRLTGISKEQVRQLARLNRKLMEPLLDRFVQCPSEVLVMNDITLYLHLGKLQRILECVRLAETFLGTAYYGSRLAKDFGAGISSRERRLTDELAAFMDQVVRIGMQPCRTKRSA